MFPRPPPATNCRPRTCCCLCRDNTALLNTFNFRRRKARASEKLDKVKHAALRCKVWRKHTPLFSIQSGSLNRSTDQLLLKQNTGIWLDIIEVQLSLHSFHLNSLYYTRLSCLSKHKLIAQEGMSIWEQNNQRNWKKHNVKELVEKSRN